jgi:hypothetical protein
VVFVYQIILRQIPEDSIMSIYILFLYCVAFFSFVCLFICLLHRSLTGSQEGNWSKNACRASSPKRLDRLWISPSLVDYIGGILPGY